MSDLHSSAASAGNLLPRREDMRRPSQTHSTAGTIEHKLHSHLQTKYYFGANPGTGDTAGPQSEAIQPGLRVGPGPADRLGRQSTAAAPPGSPGHPGGPSQATTAPRHSPLGPRSCRTLSHCHLRHLSRHPVTCALRPMGGDASGQPPFSLGALREM